MLSVVMIAAATVRYLHHRRAIAAAQTDYGSAPGDTLLALMLVCLGVFLIAYVAHQLLLAGP